MQRKESDSGRWWITVCLAVLWSCGGGGGGGGSTVLSGALIEPPANQCAGCSVGGQTVTFLALGQNEAPSPLTQASTDASGNYVSSPLEAMLGGRRAVIAVASVSSTAGLGGVESVSSGRNVKNFDVHTQIACQAAVDLTKGDDPNDPNHAVCGGTTTTLPASSIDDTRIANLEQAAAIIQDRVNLSSDVPHAACTVILCTFGGATTASAECMNGNF